MKALHLHLLSAQSIIPTLFKKGLKTVTTTKKRFLIGIGALLGTWIYGLLIAGYALAHRFDPYIRQQAIIYLQQRFDSEVELTSLSIRLPRISPLILLFTGARGTIAHVEGEGLSLRHKGRHDVPPMFAIKKFSGELDLGTLFNTPKTVRLVEIDGMDINIPPKDDNPDVAQNAQPNSDMSVIVEEVIVTNSSLSILPKDKAQNVLSISICTRLGCSRSEKTSA